MKAFPLKFNCSVERLKAFSLQMIPGDFKNKLTGKPTGSHLVNNRKQSDWLVSGAGDGRAACLFNLLKVTVPEVVSRRDLLRLLKFSSLHDVWIESAWVLLPSTSCLPLCGRIPSLHLWVKTMETTSGGCFLFLFYIILSCFPQLHHYMRNLFSLSNNYFYD